MACGFPTGLQCVFYAARSGTLMHQISGISVAFDFRPDVLCICTFAGTSVFQFLFIVHSMPNHVFLTCNIFCLLMKKLVPVSKGHLESRRTQECYRGIHISSVQSLQGCYPSVYSDGRRIRRQLLAGSDIASLASYIYCVVALLNSHSDSEHLTVSFINPRDSAGHTSVASSQHLNLTCLEQG
jgi:hypothetical protein